MVYRPLGCRRLRRLFQLAVFLTVALVLPTLARAQGTLVCNEPVNGTLPVADASNVWTFAANAGDSIIVRVGSLALSGSSSLNPNLFLYDPIGKLLTSIGDYGLKAEEVETRATTSGTFSVGVTGGSTTGSYRLTLAKAPGAISVAPGGDGGPLTNGWMHAGNIQVGSLDVWNFQANANDGIYLSLGNTQTNGVLDPYLRLYGPDGALLQQNGGYGTLVVPVAERAPSSGAYTVVVNGGGHVNGNTNGSGPYRLMLAKTGGPIVITPGNAGGPMTNGWMNTGNLNLGEVDAWTFNGNSNANIIVRMGNADTNGTLDPYLRIYAPGGLLLQSVGDYGAKAEEVDTRTTNSGQFLVILSGGNYGAGGTGPYRITLAKTDDTLVPTSGSAGGLMTNGWSYPGNIQLGEVDAWNFQASQGDSIVVRMGDATTNSTDLDPYLRLFGPDGTLLSSVGDYGTIAEEIAVRAKTNGVYLVTLNGGDADARGTGGYQIKLAKTGDPIVTAPGDQGGPLANAQITAGNMTIGNLGVWSFPAFPGSHPSLTLRKLTTDGGFVPGLRLYGPDGTLLSSTTTSSNEVVSINPTNDGVITAVVADESLSYSHAGGYQLLFACGCPPDMPVSADNGSSGTLFAGNLQVAPVDPTNQQVGVVVGVQGSATITHINQSPQAIVVNAPVFMNDVIQTGAGAKVLILFCDNTEINISANNHLVIDPYVYTPGSSFNQQSNYGLLKGVFQYISGLIGKRDPANPGIEEPISYIGIRADASEYIDATRNLLNPAAILSTASPVTLYTSVTVPANAFTLGFDYTYLQTNGTLSMAIGGIPVFSSAANPANSPSIVERVSFTVTNPAVLNLGLTELSFTFDGPAGLQMLLDNVIFPGLTNGDFSLLDNTWASRGDGNVQLAATIWPTCSEYTELSVAVTGNQASASWPLTAVNYVLQIATNLAAAGTWQNVTNAVTTSTNAFVVTLPVSAETSFYRLSLICN